MRCGSFAAVLLIALPISAATKHRAVAHPPYVPRIEHVFLVVLENVDEDVAEELPFISRLAQSGALLENYHGIAHPSQPNYIAMVAGSTYGITDDKTVTIDVRHLGDLLEAKGLTWKVYAENYPGQCYVGAIYGSPATGAYLRRHVPFINFRNVQDYLDRCNAHIVNADALDVDIATGNLPNFSFYAPNNLDNGHDSSAMAADSWLQQRFGPLLTDPRFMKDMLLIVTYDESQTSSVDNPVSTVLFGDAVRVGAESFDSYNHYNLLRTIEDIFGIGTLLQHDASAAPITGIWK